MAVERCPYCGSDRIVLDIERGEYICTNCGTVIQERVIDIEHPEPRAYTPEQYLSRMHIQRTKVTMIGSRISIEEKKKIGIRTFEDEVRRILDTALESTLRAYNEMLNIRVETSDIPLETFRKIVESLLHETRDPTRTLKLVKIMMILYVQYSKKIRIHYKTMTYILKKIRVDHKYFPEAKKMFTKYIKEEIMYVPILEEAVKYVDEQFRPLIYKIAITLLKNRTVREYHYQSIQCLTYLLVAVLAKKLRVGNHMKIMEEAIRRGICGNMVYKNFNLLDKNLSIEIC